MSAEEPPLQLPKVAGVRRVMSNVGVLLGGRVVNAPLSLLHIWMATHFLGSYGFGLIAMMYAFARTMGDLVDFQSWQTVLKYGLRPLTDGDRKGFQRVIAFSFLLDGLGGMLGFCGGLFISIFAMKMLGWPPEIHQTGTIFCLSILFMASATPTGLLRIFNRYDLISIQGVVATLVRVVGTFFLAVKGASVPALAFVWMFAEFAAWATLVFMAVRELIRRDLMRGLTKELRDLIPDLLNGHFFRTHLGIRRFALSTNLNSALALTFGHIGTLVVGAFVGPAGAGYYRVASQIAAGIAKPAALIQTTVYPEMARLWRDRATTKLYRLTIQVALTAGGIGTVLLAVTLLAGRPLLQLYIGPTGATQTMPVTLWLLAAEVVAVWGLPLEPLLFTTDRSGAATSARFLDFLVFFPGLVLVVRRYGLDGVGPITLCGVMLLIGLQLLLVLRKPSLRTISQP
ncbi:MAG: lipopolysaccharide biosynthesis protein [Gluconobacter cerinus]|uniref:lipopolysaccharide biosynthesis protein n=1 Tax=Gluconobacter cerinus TaxID=38307 RepID=UPI0039EAE44C